jgi:hypothetical protein
MIERERNERFLKNRDERLGQFLSQRTQPRPQSGTKDKSLRDHGSCSHDPAGRLPRARYSSPMAHLGVAIGSGLVLSRRSDKT